jgi:hypothetical protein
MTIIFFQNPVHLKEKKNPLSFSSKSIAHKYHLPFASAQYIFMGSMVGALQRKTL